MKTFKPVADINFDCEDIKAIIKSRGFENAVKSVSGGIFKEEYIHEVFIKALEN